MYLSVQLAARRLGVSPHTVRRWTASGLLPCTRTAGGHRRIKQEDVDELAHLIGGRNHLTTRLARERELDLLLEAADSLGDAPSGGDGLQRLASCAAALLEVSAAFVWGVEGGGERASLLAGHGTGRRLHVAGGFVVEQAPAARRALAGRAPVTVRAGDQRADPADAALLRRDGDGVLLLVPLTAGDAVLGLLEVRDRRERTFTRQELRLAGALAALAAAAVERDRLRRSASRSDEEEAALQAAIGRVAAGLAAVQGAAADDVLQAAARLATDALGGAACVASRGAATAGAVAPVPGGDAQTGPAHVLVASGGDDEGRVVLTLTLARPAATGQAELLAVVAATAAAAAAAASAPAGG